MELVCRPQRWERFVWTITPCATFDAHPQRHGVARWPEEPASIIAAARWRTERQSFLPLPELRQAIFTIHVRTRALVDAIDTPARATALHAALASMSRAVLEYRGLVSARDTLLSWLSTRAGLAGAEDSAV